jgi:serine/threonine protein kinase
LDIDPQNIVIEPENAGSFSLKLIDFGSGFTARQLTLAELAQVKNKVPFRSPELERVMRALPALIRYQQPAQPAAVQAVQAVQFDGFACDMYACGVVLYWCAMSVFNVRCLKDDVDPLWKEGVMRHADGSHSPTSRHPQNCWMCYYESQAACAGLGVQHDTNARLLPAPFLELLRRLLADDPSQRFAGGDVGSDQTIEATMQLEQLKQQVEASLQ